MYKRQCWKIADWIVDVDACFNLEFNVNQNTHLLLKYFTGITASVTVVTVWSSKGSKMIV